MSMEIKVPAVGESITEVFIGEWYVKPGDWVDIDQEIVGLETDKATFDVVAPQAGTLEKVIKKAGDKAQIGEVIAVLKPGPAPAGTKPAPKAADQGSAPTSAPASSESIVMPAAARAAAQGGINPQDVRGTGPGGRILKEDVQRELESPAASDGAARETRRVPMSPIRQTIAKRLVEAQQNAALLTTFNECDLSAVKRLREQYQDAFVKRHGVKLGFMSFFVKAVVEALNVYPQVGAQIDGTDLVFKNYVDIGIAIGAGKGLVVPVLRNAERMSFAQIEKSIANFAERAKQNKLGLEDLEGGIFTITNGGVYGSLLSTPIVNPPQSGVLGMHGIVDRPIAVNGQVEIRPMMYLALTYDHRVVDGREAVSFLKRITEVIEDPTRLILEV
ncbi:MAG: 2-oxoglutarate dehydrogenase complex dihydrolipoyllysine-residue succinyltransferase [Planctomycetaceae bacterium]|nr:2-oxoglutarate dehydrogenase complex dihydrolipoyllysine-residue succinyltransferase [Planctomycetaceae bacterium]MCB9951974.1 2-oxoglutarate dehydrogenase complex dihydrolipoyllysine-residue succinyltransferase [Planctomycetaceae bacterium]